MQSNKRTTKPGPLRAGFEFQDACGVGILVDWLCEPERYECIKLEADEFGWLDDIVLFCSDGRLILYQAKYAIHPFCPKDFISLEKLLTPIRQRQSSLLARLFESWNQADKERSNCLAVLATNRIPAPSLERFLTSEDEYGRLLQMELLVSDSIWMKLLKDLNASDREVRAFLTALRFDLRGLDYQGRLEAAKRRFINKLGGTEVDLHRLVKRAREWATWKDKPSSTGKIYLEDVQSAIGFVTFLRPDLVDACVDVTKTEIKHFVGSSFQNSRYIDRDADPELSDNMEPWQIGPIESENPEGNIIDGWYKILRTKILERDSKHVIYILSYLTSFMNEENFPEKKEVINTSLNIIRELSRRIIESSSDDLFNKESDTLLKYIESEFLSLRKIIVESYQKHDHISSKITNTFKKALSSRSLKDLDTALFEYDRLNEGRKSFEISLGMGIHFTQDQLQLYFETGNALINNTHLARLTEKVKDNLKRRLVVILADGGNGKTWSLCKLVQQLQTRCPVVYLSGRDPRIVRTDSILDVLAKAIAQERPTWGITSTTLRAALEHRLLADEQLCVVVDGIDWMGSISKVNSILKHWILELDTLPIRLIISCRSTYWSRFRTALENWPGLRMMVSNLASLSDKEWRRVEVKYPQLHPPTELHAKILRSPLCFGIWLDLFGSKSLPGDSVFPTSLIKLIELYIKEIIKQIADALCIDQWLVDRLIWNMWSSILDQAISSSHPVSPGVIGAVTRGEIRALLLKETGEFPADALDGMVSAGLLATDGPNVWHANDLVLEYGIAQVILNRYFPLKGSSRLTEFKLDLNMSQEWLPGQVGILTFIAIELTSRGICLWEYIDEDFNGRTDWLNMISLLLPPDLNSLDFMVELLQTNAKALKKARDKLIGANPRLLEMLGTSDEKQNYNAQLVPSAFSGDLSPRLLVPRRELRYQMFQVIKSTDFDLGAWNPSKLDRIPDPLKPDFDFWSSQFPSAIIPLIGKSETPAPTRQYLADRIALLCADLRLPIELTARIYQSYASAAQTAGVSLHPSFRMKTLICDDAMGDFMEEIFTRFSIPGITDINSVPNGNGDLALKMLKTSRYSLLMIDQLHPGLPGNQVVHLYREWIEKSKRDDDMCIIFITGYGDMDKNAQEVGCDGFISKPSKVQDIVMSIFGYGGRDHIHLEALRDSLFNIIKEKEDINNV